MTEFRIKVARWFPLKEEFIVFALLGIAGILTAILSFPSADGFPFQLGKELWGLFVAPLLCLGYLGYTIYRGRQLTHRILIRFLLLYFIQITPFFPLLFQEYSPTSVSDLNRYHLFAKNMIENHTLWGGDNIFFHGLGKHYIIQPGYRYYILIELLVFGKLIRMVQFFDMLLYLITFFFFIKSVQHSLQKTVLRNLIVLCAFLMSPATLKMQFLGLPAWLTVALLMWTVYFYCYKKKPYHAAVLLGLIPFFRQNLMIGCLLLFLPLVFRQKSKYGLIAAFIIPLLLPLYHNLYYAGEWRLLTDIFRYPFLNYQEPEGVVTGFNAEFTAWNLLHYLGIDHFDGKTVFALTGFIFLPFALYLLYRMLKDIPHGFAKYYFIIALGSVVVPVILLGNAYYPRFELVNVAFMLAAYLLIPSRLDRGAALP